jgi:rod shape-determining protein MreC
MNASADSSPLFAEGSAGTLRLVGYLVLAVILMVADHRAQLMQQLRAAAGVAVTPVYWLAALPGRVAGFAHVAVSDRVHLADENARLREQLLLTQARLSRLAAVQEQNARLRDLLDARTRLGLKAQLGEIVDVDLDPFRHRMLLDIGVRDGIAEGQAVIDARGVLGQVVDVEPGRATLLLVTDPGAAIPVRVERTGLRAIAYGSGDVGTLRLPHLPFSADVRVGDTLVTSGLGARFPAGLPVGLIRVVEPDDSATFLSALATPAAGLADSGEVLVLHDQRERLTAADGSQFEFVGPPEAFAGVASETDGDAP